MLYLIFIGLIIGILIYLVKSKKKDALIEKNLQTLAEVERATEVVGVQEEIQKKAGKLRERVEALNKQ